MSTLLTLGAAARHCGISKGTISKAIKSGKLSATRREDGSWGIDGAELARYVEVNGHRFRSETDSPEQPETPDPATEFRIRAELAEQRLADLRETLADMRQQRDKWESVAQRLSLPAPKPAETPPATPAAEPRKGWWRFGRRATG